MNRGCFWFHVGWFLYFAKVTELMEVVGLFLWSLFLLQLLLLVLPLTSLLLAYLLATWSVRAQRSGARPLRFLFVFLFFSFLWLDTTWDVPYRTVGAIVLGFFGRSGFYRFWDNLGDPFWNIFGHWDLEFHFLFRFVVGQLFVSIFEYNCGHLGLSQLCFHAEGIAKHKFPQKSLFMFSAPMFFVFSDALGCLGDRLENWWLFRGKLDPKRMGCWWWYIALNCGPLKHYKQWPMTTDLDRWLLDSRQFPCPQLSCPHKESPQRGLADYVRTKLLGKYQDFHAIFQLSVFFCHFRWRKLKKSSLDGSFGLSTKSNKSKTLVFGEPVLVGRCAHPFAWWAFCGFLGFPCPSKR